MAGATDQHPHDADTGQATNRVTGQETSGERFCFVDQAGTSDCQVTITDTLPSGGDDASSESLVKVAVWFSSINYKDALLLTGRKGVNRIPSLVAGIDAVGEIAQDPTGRFRSGDLVVCNGGGLGESRNGGLATSVLCPPEATIALPSGMSPKVAAAVGTAGYTAALSLVSIKEHFEAFPVSGPIAITGASGGVGTFGLAMASKLFDEVHAVTRDPDKKRELLTSLGATDVVAASHFAETKKPLAKGEYAAAIDAVGGDVLAGLIPHMREEGIVCACGLAGDAKLSTTVMPLILRGVTLRGINSVTQPLARREKAWKLIADTIDESVVEKITRTVTLDEIISAAEAVIAGTHTGRTVVSCRDDQK